MQSGILSTYMLIYNGIFLLGILVAGIGLYVIGRRKNGPNAEEIRTRRIERNMEAKRKELEKDDLRSLMQNYGDDDYDSDSGGLMLDDDEFDWYGQSFRALEFTFFI